MILGEAGVGKTHMIGTLRRRTWQAGGWFVLLDIIGITDFWQTAALGFVSSLHQPMTNGQTQYQALLSAILNVIAKRGSFDQATKAAIREWRAKPDKTRLDTVDLFLKLLRRLDPEGAPRHQDVIRALLLLDSEDFDAANLAYCWLQGLNVDDDRRRLLKFSGPPPSHDKLVGGMLWVMGLAGPTLIAVDQIDSIISASSLLVGADETRDDDSERRARHIIETLAGGLMALHDLKKRAMTVVSCLQVTWPVIKTKAIKSAAHRFQELPVLERVNDDDIVEKLISGRLSGAYADARFQPPYRTWPFRPAAIRSAVGLSPREILIRCEDHRQRCIAAGEVFECDSLGRDVEAAPESSPSRELDRGIRAPARDAADISPFLDEENEDATTAELLIQSCELLLKHLDLPRSDRRDRQTRSGPQEALAARPHLASPSMTKDDREQHYCFRFLGHANAIAFQSRLKAAMTASGIDRALTFRRLFVCAARRAAEAATRPGSWSINSPAPAASSSRRPTTICAPSSRCRRWPSATRRASRRGCATASRCSKHRYSRRRACVRRRSSLRRRRRRRRAARRRAPARRRGRRPLGARRATTVATSRAIPVGRRFERGRLGDRVALAADLLPRHVAILAGSGSGKTVLLRRIIEEAALIDIPAVVLDVNNDLARLGDRWPTRPEGFDADDVAKAEAYAARVDVVVWTPGLASGNPLALNLLPDFAAIGDKGDRAEDERRQAVEMARATLAPYLPGAGQRTQLKQGILADALRIFARNGGGRLVDLVDLLAEFPATGSEIGDAAKLAGEIADQLRAAIATNPLLQSAGKASTPNDCFAAATGERGFRSSTSPAWRATKRGRPSSISCR